MRAVDLHVHSTRSDGTYTPSQLVDYAKEKGLRAFALTDHDTVDGLKEAIQYAETLKKACSSLQEAAAVPEVIPGIEFSTEYLGRDIHIVGLYIDYDSSSFREKLREFVDSRIIRNQKMCRLLQKEGVDVTYENLLSEFPDAVITRAHYAKYMLEHGYTKSMAEAFERYIGDGCPCYIPRQKVTPGQAVELVSAAGGIPVLAHPVLYHMSDKDLDVLTFGLVKAGLVALEAVYSTYTEAEERSMRKLASKYGLLLSGGSDFHGGNKPGLDLGCGYGKLFIPETILDDIQKACHSSRRI